LLTGVSGVDLASASYRVALFRSSGFTLWDPNWYAGHWTLNYSVLFPPVGALLGIAATDVLSAAAAAWAFDRLAVAHFGRLGRRGAIVFAAGTLVQVAVGRLPFLLGEAFGLLALLAAQPSAAIATARPARSAARMATATILAAAAGLASPLAGAFLALAALAWLLGALPRWSLRAGAIAAAASLPVIALELLFPGQGSQPFAPLNLVAMLVALAAVALLLAPAERTLRIAAGLYAVVLVASYLLPSALGGNITRLGTAVGLGLLACLPLAALKPARLSGAPRLLVFAVALAPLLLGQWSPALSALAGNAQRSNSPAFFKPLIAYLVPRDEPLARVEVVPTATHWEADYVARRLPLARGWERQLDTYDNPIFYRRGLLTPASYRAWLEHNGVRYVALPDVALDYAGVREGRLIRAGVPGLSLVWQNSDWRVYELSGASAIVSGPGRLRREHGATVDLLATRAESLLLRVRYSDAWHVDRGSATLSESRGGWIEVRARRPGPIVLTIKLDAPF
jgi:hypothetical protein